MLDLSPRRDQDGVVARMVVLGALVLLVLLPALVSANCVQYGEPPRNYTGPAIPFNETIVDCFNYQNQSTCCSVGQVAYLKERMVQAQQAFPGCSACLTNLLNLWCGFACESTQSEWLKAIDIENGIVQRTNFTVCQSTCEGLWDSCAALPFGGALTVGAVFPTCEAFLSIQGSQHSCVTTVVPDSDPDAYCPSMMPCDNVCSCNVCNSVACDQVDAPSCKIHGINCMAYYLIVGYSVVFVLTLAAGVFYRFRQSRSSAGGRMRRGRGGTYSQLG